MGLPSPGYRRRQRNGLGPDQQRRHVCGRLLQDGHHLRGDRARGDRRPGDRRHGVSGGVLQGEERGVAELQDCSEERAQAASPRGWKSLTSFYVFILIQNFVSFPLQFFSFMDFIRL